MLFAPLRELMLGVEYRPQVVKANGEIREPSDALVLAKSLFPDAKVRRIVFANAPDEPIVVRMRQPFEWTPNGRTQLTFAANGQVTIEDAAAANGSSALGEKLYPIHSAKVGGWAWKLAMTASGLALVVLGMLATWSFWVRRSGKRRPRKNGRQTGRASVFAKASGQIEC